VADKVQIPDFMSWALNIGEEKFREMVRAHLAEMKEASEAVKNAENAQKNGVWWDDIIAPNDDRSQWRQGGDCNICGKRKYCKTQCRANRTLKEASSSFLYQKYLSEYPEAKAFIAAKKLTPDQLLKMMGIES